MTAAGTQTFVERSLKRSIGSDLLILLGQAF